MMDLHEDLKSFDQFRKDLLPALQQDVMDGMSPEDLRKKYLSYLTARTIQIGLTDTSALAALSAIRDVQDRTEGKPVETKHVINKYENLPDAQLDAALLSQMDDLKDLLN